MYSVEAVVPQMMRMYEATLNRSAAAAAAPPPPVASPVQSPVTLSV
jgi:hypothetical protein